MRMDGVEGPQQTFAALLVQTLNRLAQPPDGFGQIFMFGGQGRLGGQNLVQFLVGPQIDATQPFAVPLEPVEFFLHRLGRRQFVAGRGLRKAEQFGLGAANVRRDHMRDFVAARPRGFDPGFAAGFFFPRHAHRLEGAARGPIRLGESCLRRDALIGGFFAGVLGRFDLAHQGLPGHQKRIWRLQKFLEFLGSFRVAGLELAGLTARTRVARNPGLAFLLNCLQTLFPRLSVAQIALQGGPRFGRRGAILGRRRACLVQLRGQMARQFQLGEGVFGLRALLAGLSAGCLNAN